jgi:hypothetical protein
VERSEIVAVSQIRVGDTLVYTGGRRFTVDKITPAGEYVLLEFVQPAELQRDVVHRGRKAQRLVFDSTEER